MPGFWRYEVSGALRPVIVAYLTGAAIDAAGIALMRGYLRQWIEAPVWHGPSIEQLRAEVDGLTSRAAIAAWLDRAELAGIDPL